MPVPALVTVFTLVNFLYAPGANEAPVVQNYYFSTQADCDVARKSLGDANDDFYANMPVAASDDDSADSSDDKKPDVKPDKKDEGVPVVHVVSAKCFKALVSSKALEKID